MCGVYGVGEENIFKINKSMLERGFRNHEHIGKKKQDPIINENIEESQERKRDINTYS